MLEDQVTSFMRPAPVPNDDETGLKEDLRVADPLSNDFLNLWNTTARVNREVFTEVFRPVPCNLVRNWEAYNVSICHRAGPVPCALFNTVQSYKPKVKVGHVVPGVSVDHVKERLSLVRGSLVEAQIVCCFYPLPFAISCPDF
jgi:phospholipase D1/2